MKVSPRDWPWPGASNLFVPLIPTYLDTLVSRLAQLVFTPRLYVAKGTTPESESIQHEIEKYYNTEAWRHDWIERQYQWLHLGARDGTSYLEVVWQRREQDIKVVKTVPVMDEETQTPVIDMQTGEVMKKAQVFTIRVKEEDDVALNPVELRDLVTIPAWAWDLDRAYAVARRCYLTPDDLDAMVESGDLWKDAVDETKKYVEHEDELTSDEHLQTYTAGDKIDVSQTEYPDSMLHQAQNHLKVWRIHSRQFDLDRVKGHEERVYWLHEKSHKLLGAKGYGYWHGKRPWVTLTIMPRPNRPYGYAVPERLSSIQVETNSIHNQRRDEIDMRLSPPRWRKPGVNITTGAMAGTDKVWGPGVEYAGGKDDVGVVNMGEPLQAAWQEEDTLRQGAERLLGLNDPLIGKTGAGARRTKYEMQLIAAAAGIRVDLMAKRMQQAMKKAFSMIHQLKLQYGPGVEEISIPGEGGSPQKLTITKEKLAMEYELDINGSGSPLDRGARRQELLFLYSLLQRNMLVASNPQHLYALTRMLVEEYEIANITAILGTEEEAVKMMQQIMQAANAQGGGQPGGQPGRAAGGQPPHRRRGGGGQPAAAGAPGLTPPGQL